MTTGTRNIIAGFLIVAVTVGFLVRSYSGLGAAAGAAYPLTATFAYVGPLSPGDPVRLGGVTVGSVIDQALDPKANQVTVTMEIAEGIEIPLDTAARVLPDGLVGGASVSLELGGETEILEPGDRFEFTQDAVDIVDTLLRLIRDRAETSGTP